MYIQIIKFDSWVPYGQNITAIHRPGESFAVEFVKICRYKTFWMRIFERTTFLLFRRCSIHVKLCILATYSARNAV